MDAVFDIAIIGGGINGCGCAADAALRGLSVALIERGDLASQTSSCSSKLIHGGLRYLEQYQFPLVRKALNERQTLLNIAPNLVHPLPFVLPQKKPIRSTLWLRAGLFLYDHLSTHNTLPKSKRVTRRQNPLLFSALNADVTQGFRYFDCSTDDARLTIANAIQAKQHGATLLTHTELIEGRVQNNQWHLTLSDMKHQSTQSITAKTLINATGPWVASVNDRLHIPNQHQIRLSKGSHIVIPKLYEGEHAYVLQHPDKRVVFTIPYFGHTLVGTTDVSWTNDIEHLTIDASEISYLLDLIARYFKQKPTADQIITTWSGVRPLLFEPDKTAATLSRDYVYTHSDIPAPCITIYGGKITTYRLLAEQVIDQLQTTLPNLKPSITNHTALPGAVLGLGAYQQYLETVQTQFTWLPKPILNHYLRTYGTITKDLLKDCHHLDDLGMPFSPLLYQREVDYLVQEEWATSADDILWRRTKLGLTEPDIQLAQLNAYLTKTEQPATTKINEQFLKT